MPAINGGYALMQKAAHRLPGLYAAEKWQAVPWSWTAWAGI